MASYLQGGWYDNPATGKNQRFWDGSFLPVGQTDPAPQNNSSSNNNNNNNSSNSSSAIDPVAQAQKLREFNIQSNQPIISSLQSSIPTTQAAYAQRGQTLLAEKGDLQSRYDSVLADLTNREGKADTAAAREFGKRGVPLSSGAYDQYVDQNVTQPYGVSRAQTGADFADISTQLADQIAQNPIQQQTAIDAINQAIAQLNSGDPAASIQGALQLQQLQQQADQGNLDRASREKIASLGSAVQDKLYTLGTNDALVNGSGNVLYRNANSVGNQLGASQYYPPKQ